MQETINIILNGETIEVQSQTNLFDLLAKLEIEPRNVAIEKNREIVPRSLWSETFLQTDDKLEIVQFVGGG